MNRLKELRLSKKLKQTELAAMLNISQGALSGWETGRYSIGNEELKKLADFFNVSVDYLLGLPANATARTAPQEAEGLQSFLQEAAEKDNTEYALKDTIEIRIQMELTALLRHADEDTKQAIYEYLRTSSETKKALTQVIALTQNK